MKRIFSLALAGVMMFSALPMAYAADVDYQNGTEVEFTGSRTTVNADGTETHNAEYTITVPALLAPGGSGTVTLQGMWPSDATVKVTAEDKVEMVNNINSADKKTLAVTFTAIELAGNNTVAVSDDETVSVADISNALFGTWSGKFNYNVDYVAGSGNTGDSGTTEPSDPDTGDGEDANLITFSFDSGLTFQAEEGMTWEQWVESEYNQNPEQPFTVNKIQKGETVYSTIISSSLFVSEQNSPSNYPISPEDTIKAGFTYKLFGIAGYGYTIVEEPEANLITFTIDGVEYQAEKDMLWSDWIASQYNTGNFTVTADGFKHVLPPDEEYKYVGYYTQSFGTNVFTRVSATTNRIVYSEYIIGN